MELPLCLEEYEPELNLTVADRRELIQNLAEHGPSSIGKFITEHSEDSRSGITKLVKRLRSSLEAQINRTRELIERKFQRRNEQVWQDIGSDLKPINNTILERDSEIVRAREMSYIDREIDSRLVDILTRDDLLNFIINLEEEPVEIKKGRGWWARFKAAFLRFVQYIVNLIQRFINWLKSPRKKKSEEMIPRKSKRSNILLKFPSGNKLWENIDHNLDNALATSPDFKRTIDREMGVKHGKKFPSQRRVTWQKYLNREKYEDEIRKVVHRRIKHAIKREQRRLASEYKIKKRRVKKMEQLLRDKTHREVRQRELEARIKQLEKQKTAEMQKLKKQISKKIHQVVKSELVNELEDAGFVQKDKNNKPKITSRLIDRFAEIVLSDEIQKLPSKFSYSASTHGMPHGVYEKKKLQTAVEASRMDIVSSMINARLAHPQQRHIYDSDIITHTEMRSSISHVVLIFDKSGSMEENNRILAAKKSVLALYKAVKHRNQQNIVDFIAFDSTVHVMDLLQAWRSTPSGFTNTAEALSTAYELVKETHADRTLIYLITDGLPEAYTDLRTGEPRAGDLEKSLSIAVKKAKKLKKFVNLKFTIILLEPQEIIYKDAAKTIAQAAGGSVIVTDPNELATEMLMDYIEV